MCCFHLEHSTFCKKYNLDILWNLSDLGGVFLLFGILVKEYASINVVSFHTHCKFYRKVDSLHMRPELHRTSTERPRINLSHDNSIEKEISAIDRTCSPNQSTRTDPVAERLCCADKRMSEIENPKLQKMQNSLERKSCGGPSNAGQPPFAPSSYSTTNSSTSSIRTDEYNLYPANSYQSQQSDGHSRRYYVPFCHSSEEDFNPGPSVKEWIDPVLGKPISASQQRAANDITKVHPSSGSTDKEMTSSESDPASTNNQEAQTSLVTDQNVGRLSKSNDIPTCELGQQCQSTNGYDTNLDSRDNGPQIFSGTKEQSSQAQVLNTPTADTCNMKQNEEFSNSSMLVKSGSSERYPTGIKYPSVQSLFHQPDVEKHLSCEELITLQTVSTSMQNLKWALRLPKILSFDMVEQSDRTIEMTSGIFSFLIFKNISLRVFGTYFYHYALNVK